MQVSLVTGANGGLGLAIARGIAEQMGGTITARNAPDGVTFVLGLERG